MSLGTLNIKGIRESEALITSVCPTCGYEQYDIIQPDDVLGTVYSVSCRGDNCNTIYDIDISAILEKWG